MRCRSCRRKLPDDLPKAKRFCEDCQPAELAQTFAARAKAKTA
jgi:hypothetical protein